NEQEHERDVRLVEIGAHRKHHCRRDNECAEPENNGDPSRADHSLAGCTTKRYPTPGSVMMYCGRTGLSSILRRRCATCTRRYCCASPDERPVQTLVKSWRCVRVRPACVASTRNTSHSIG